jgi:hypothetical protein
MAVRALLHYALDVPDQTVGEKFYRNFGLVDEAGRDGAVHLRPAPLKRESVLLYIPEECAWEPRDFPEADALYRWGPPVPDDFGLNRELEA